MDIKEFDKFAEEYLNLHRQNIRITGEGPEFFAEYKIRDLKRVSYELKVLPDNILDFGTGVGNSIPFLAKYFPETNIHGVDVSEKSLALVRKRFGSLGEFSLFDGELLPYPDELFDIAIAACVFHHIPFKEHVHLIQEISRTIRYGGIIMIYEHNPYNPLTRYAVNTCPFDEHSATFSEKLIKPFILGTSTEGDTILDPFLGSGTTAKVSLDNGRKCIGYEISPVFVDTSFERCGDDMNQSSSKVK